MTKHKYYRGNTEISEQDALENGMLRDGCTCRVMMRDNAMTNDSIMTFSDGTDDETAGCRPGWRIPNMLDRRAQIDAYQHYERELTNRWRCRDGQQLCPDCLGSGLGEDNEACGGCGGSGTVDDGYERSPNEAVANTAADSRPLAQRMQDHRRTMDQLYAQRDAELSEAWRNK
jgi:hypothetical protein